MKIDTNIQPIYAKNIEEFNKFVKRYSAKNKIILSKNKNISQATLRNLPASLTWLRGTHFEFQLVSAKKRLRVVYAVHYDSTKNGVSPKISYNALNYFKGIYDVIPDDSDLPEITPVKCPENPESLYYNYCNERFSEMTIEGCSSLDRNSSFLASMLKVFPQTKPFVEKYYKEKLFKKQTNAKDYDEFKMFDKIIVGWLRNPKIGKTKAWQMIINDSNLTIHNLRKRIEKAGCTVVLVNTDAVKFKGDFDYSESTKIGDFKYEFKNCKMFIKGPKSYGVEIDGKWKFKNAGRSKLDLIKSRENWTLNDFKNLENFQEFVKMNEKGELFEVYEEEI